MIRLLADRVYLNACENAQKRIPNIRNPLLVLNEMTLWTFNKESMFVRTVFWHFLFTMNKNELSM